MAVTETPTLTKAVTTIHIRFRKALEIRALYGAGLQHGERMEASQDERHELASDHHVAVAANRPPDQARNGRQPTSVDRDKNSGKD